MYPTAGVLPGGITGGAIGGNGAAADGGGGIAPAGGAGGTGLPSGPSMGGGAVS
ncbi:hypothetical protein [Cryobacterium sp. BB307]|uniref:hypothetical protein n=1 Tax=Cryobacterium sp. BB307 TaxID=2716317 RepID=UPI001444EB19|nr:hypothetical protein [Cryobacterium sp. BB307]